MTYDHFELGYSDAKSRFMIMEAAALANGWLKSRAEASACRHFHNFPLAESPDK
jgi:hypothetical protein